MVNGWLVQVSGSGTKEEKLAYANAFNMNGLANFK
jgi:hypothetical protein